jgi:hypothetical protein
MTAPVFVSHSSKDRKVAGAICSALERRGVACWISSRDIAAGENFQEAIDRAIRTARAMVLVFSQNANSSTEITKELALASQYAVPVIPVRSEDVAPTGAFRYELATRQWIDLFEDWERAIERITEQLSRVGVATSAAVAPPPPRRRPAWPIAAAAAALVLLATAGGWWLLRPSAPKPPPVAAVAPPAAAPRILLRSAPTTRPPGSYTALLVRNNFFDASANAAGEGIRHEYKQQVIGDDVVVIDAATGLMWQKGGSRDVIDFSEAPAYVAELNNRKFAGFDDWRLPTVEEAMSLMEPKKHGSYHVDRIFQPEVTVMWTADSPGVEGRALMIYFHDGVLARESVRYNGQVRAVRTLPP